MAPQIHTYHCLCTALLLTTTHALSSLPRRSSSFDAAIMLPLPATPPPASASLPPSGYTLLLNLSPDRAHAPGRKPTLLVRRADGGFEKRVLYRCARCRLVVGYELAASPTATDAATTEMGGSREEGEYEGRVLYVLPAGVLSTDVMVGKRRVAEEDVEVGRGGALAAFE